MVLNRKKMWHLLLLILLIFLFFFCHAKAACIGYGLCCYQEDERSTEKDAQINELKKRIVRKMLLLLLRPLNRWNPRKTALSYVISSNSIVSNSRTRIVERGRNSNCIKWYLCKQKRSNTVMLIVVIHVPPVLYEFSSLINGIDTFFENDIEVFLSILIF
jgi:hypothetical protein